MLAACNPAHNLTGIQSVPKKKAPAKPKVHFAMNRNIRAIQSLNRKQQLSFSLLRTPPRCGRFLLCGPFRGVHILAWISVASKLRLRRTLSPSQSCYESLEVLWFVLLVRPLRHPGCRTQPRQQVLTHSLLLTALRTLGPIGSRAGFFCEFSRTPLPKNTSPKVP